MGPLTTSFITVVVVLCTLHGPEPRRSRIVELGRSEASVVAGSAAGRL
jgi:hypothetical protein